MATNGDYIRPLFPGFTLPDSTRVGVQRSIEVGPVGGMVRDALAHVLPGEPFADDDWLTVAWDDGQLLGDSPGTTAIVDDGFTTTSLSASWVRISGTPTVSGGRLHLPNGFPQSRIQSMVTHTLAATTMSMLGFVAPAGAQSDSNKTRGLLIQDAANPNTNFIQLIKYSTPPGLLLCRTNPGTLVTFPYNATNHANLRVREAGGQTYFETSAAGITWNVLRQVPTPAWVPGGTVWASLYAGAASAPYSDPLTEASLDRFLWA